MSVYKSASIIGKRRIKLAPDDRVFYGAIYAILAFLLIVVLYPMIYIVSASFSSPYAVSTGRVVLWPVELGIEGYKAVFENNSVIIGYRNTIIYTVCATMVNIFMTLIAAYPLSRRDLPGRNIFMFIFTFTMIFNGGLVPTYMLMRDLRLINTPLVMIIPGAISVYNMIITRTFIVNNIPVDMLEAAHIDGCSDARYFFSIVLPLSKAIIAVLVIFYAIGHWNSYFNAMLYLNRRNLFPLQLILREILITNTLEANQIMDPELAIARQGMAEALKYSLIMVSTLPVMCLYPFVQKYFVKGVMIGSIKG